MVQEVAGKGDIVDPGSRVGGALPGILSWVSLDSDGEHCTSNTYINSIWIYNNKLSIPFLQRKF